MENSSGSGLRLRESVMDEFVLEHRQQAPDNVSPQPPTHPAQPMPRSIFISYKRHHAASDALVRLLEDALGDEFTLLRDQTMAPGKPWSCELYDWLLRCDAGIAIVTPEAAGADWCRREWTVLAARQQTAGLPVFPLHLGGIVATGILDEIQGLHWDDNALVRLRTDLLALPPTRAATADDFLAAHQAWLRWQFRDSPVMGQEPYALRDVYIETECGCLPWGDINEAKPGQTVDAFRQANGGRLALVDAVLGRMADPAFKDLIVVQAGPGSGKSAFTLRIADELMAQGFLPILVRFRDLRLATFADVGELIDDAIRVGASDEESPQASASIVAHVLGLDHTFRGTRLCKAVFILDGWDEVSLTGNVTYQAQLKDWLPRLREYFLGRRGAPVRLLLTGRPSAEVGGSGVLHKTTPVLTMRPIRPDQLRQYAQAIQLKLAAASAAGKPTAWTIAPARLEPLFTGFAAWFEGYADGKDGQQTSSAEVLGNPLLAYLSLRVVAASSVAADTLLSEPSALYHELIEATVQHAGKGADAGLQAAVHRGGERLRRLLHEVACTISILRGESVSYTELTERLQDTGLPIQHDLLQDWTNTRATESALRELVVNFYFKGGNTALGCEFLHKSFREYLYAEAIVCALDDAITSGLPLETFPDTSGAYARDFLQGTAEFKLSRRLAYLLAPQWLSRDVETHLGWLLKRAAGADPARWQRIRDLVTNVYAWWAEGVHLRPQPTGSRVGNRWQPPFVNTLFAQSAPFDDPQARFIPVRSTALDAHLGHALMRLACVLHAELFEAGGQLGGRRALYQTGDSAQVRFRPGGGGFMRALMARLDADGWRVFGGLRGAISGPVDLDGEDLQRFDLGGADLRKASLRNTSLRQASLFLTNFGGADLEGTNFEFARVLGTNFINANMEGTKIRRAAINSEPTRRQIRGKPRFFFDPDDTDPNPP